MQYWERRRQGAEDKNNFFGVEKMKSYTMSKINFKVVMQSKVRFTQLPDGTWQCDRGFCVGYGMTKRDALIDFRSRMLVALGHNFSEASGKIAKRNVNGRLQWVKK